MCRMKTIEVLYIYDTEYVELYYNISNIMWLSVKVLAISS